MKTARIIMKSIGVVQTHARGDEVKNKLHISKIVLNERLKPALDGITGFSHTFVLYWLHKITSNQRKTLQVHPRGRRDLQLQGIFATRTNLRPDPIGLTLCEILAVEGNVLTVRGLDAFDGTPVLDLKPFDPWDCAPNARVPEWWKKLEAEKHGKAMCASQASKRHRQTASEESTKSSVSKPHP